jgi:hypothetical protein
VITCPAKTLAAAIGVDRGWPQRGDNGKLVGVDLDAAQREWRASGWA